MDLTVDTKILAGLVCTAVTCYITVRVMLADFKVRINSLEESAKEGDKWKAKMADALHELALVLGKVEQKLEDLDKSVTRLQDK